MNLIWLEVIFESEVRFCGIDDARRDLRSEGNKNKILLSDQNDQELRRLGVAETTILNFSRYRAKSILDFFFIIDSSKTRNWYTKGYNSVIAKAEK